MKHNKLTAKIQWNAENLKISFIVLLKNISIYCIILVVRVKVKIGSEDIHIVYLWYYIYSTNYTN